MKSVYIAGPIAAETEEERKKNIKKGERAAKRYYELGFAVFCPHTQIIDDAEMTYEQWMEADLYWLAKCDVVDFLPGWGNSNGARIEHMTARALGKEIEYVREELD